MFNLLEQGEDLAVPTVISRQDSTPRLPGSRMLLTAGSKEVGTIGGGSVVCLATELERVNCPVGLKIGAIILAAGFSSRMGEMKALLPIGGHTMLEHVVRLFKSAGLKDIIVVSGHEHEKIEARLSGSDVKTVYNPFFRQGMFSSIQTGVACLEKTVEGFFILPVDMPLVQADSLLALVKVFQEAGPEIILHPSYKGRCGHPPLLGSAVAEALLQWQGAEGLRGFFRQYAGKQQCIEVDDEYILFDIDTPEDYLRITEL